MRYAAISVSSAAGSPSLSCFASCATTSRSPRDTASLGCLGPRTTSPASSATATRSASAAMPTRPCTSRRSPSRHGTFSVETAAGRSAAGSASSSVSTRPSSPRNSNRRKISLSSERSGGWRTNVAESTPSSRSRRIVASSFDAAACSAFSAIAFERAGDSSPACSTTSSSEPYCEMSCPAVLSPIPGMPGMLSLVSPFSPMKSGIWSGRMPYRASTRSGV